LILGIAPEGELAGVAALKRLLANHEQKHFANDNGNARFHNII